MKKTILITGASGYLGPHVIDALLALGHEIIAVDIAPAPGDKRVHYFQRSIDDIDQSVFCATGLPDACLHLAWRNGFTHNAKSHMEELSSHYAFLTRMASFGIKQISVIGSVHEVGYFEGEVDENTPANPRSLYGIAKNALRASLEISLPELGAQLQWLRLFYIIGDYARGQSVFSQILLKDKEGQATLPFTSGMNKFDFITMDELSAQIGAVVSQNTVDGIIHCCSGKATTIREKIDEFIATNDLKIRPQYGVLPDRAYDSPAIWGSRKKIEAILNSASREESH
ncbi:nucleoside-diphosphate sugar epimerase [Burkholderiaceae bacterium 16]|nr:nucleoside-diphosphate sugar epimerase [Burkholderiaceae bacterium 16]